MPLFAFRCTICQHEFEELIRHGLNRSEPELKMTSCNYEQSNDLDSNGEQVFCPACKSGKIEQVLTAPSPLKTGAFPYKIGPVHPSAKRKAGSLCQSGCSAK